MDWNALLANGLSNGLLIGVIGYLFLEGRKRDRDWLLRERELTAQLLAEQKAATVKEGELRDRDRTDQNKAFSEVASSQKDLTAAVSRNTDVMMSGNAIRAQEAENVRTVLTLIKRPSSTNLPSVG